MGWRSGRGSHHRRARRDDGVLTLDAVGRGGRVRVIRVRGSRGLVHRLAVLGLVPGSILTVTRPRGPAIVTLGGARLAIGRTAARAVEVEEAGP